MKQLSQIDSSETHISVKESLASAPAASGALLPEQEAGGAELSKPRDSSNQNAEPEHLLKLIASLEVCNAVLLDKLLQAQGELATLRQSKILQGVESTDDPEQLHTWERKIKMGWRSP